MSLSDYHILIEDLSANIKRVSNKLSGWPKINHFARRRLTDTAIDIVSFSDIFAQAHIEATFWAIEDTNAVAQNLLQMNPARLEKMVRRSQSQAGQDSEKSARNLKMAYKAYFFFIRAFQDCAYAVLLNLTGETPGQYSSMNDCIKKAVNSTYKIIDSIEGYIDWFKKFKAKRDIIKLGVDFSLCGPHWDVGVGFNKTTAEGGQVIDGIIFALVT